MNKKGKSLVLVDLNDILDLFPYFEGLELDFIMKVCLIVKDFIIWRLVIVEIGWVLLMLLNFDEFADTAPDIDGLFGNEIKLLIDGEVLFLLLSKEITFRNELKVELLEIILNNKQLVLKSFLFHLAFFGKNTYIMVLLEFVFIIKDPGLFLFS